MIDAMKAHAAKHFQSYLIGVLLGLSGCLVAVYDNFYSISKTDMVPMGWWQVVALVAKCLAGGVTAIIGFMMKSPLEREKDARDQDKKEAAEDAKDAKTAAAEPFAKLP